MGGSIRADARGHNARAGRARRYARRRGARHPLTTRGGRLVVLGLFALVALAPVFQPRDADAAVVRVFSSGPSADKTPGTSLDLSLGSFRGSSSIIVTFAMDAAAGEASVSDDQGNPYHLDADVTNPRGVRTLIFSTHGIDAGPTQVHVTHPNVSARAATALVVEGLELASPLDQTATGQGSGKAPATALTPATTQEQELVVGAIGVEDSLANSFTPGAGFTYVSNAGTTGGKTRSNISVHPEYRGVGVSGSYAANGTLSASSQWAAAVATYRADITSPPPPPMPDLEASSDSGASATDNITNERFMGFSGTTEPWALVELFRDGKPLEATEGGVVDGMGNWRALVDSTGMEGQRAVTVRAVDAAGNRGTSSEPLIVTVDPRIAQPTPELAASSDSGSSQTDNVTNDTTPTFQGTTDPEATVRLLIRLSEGADLLGEVSASATGSWSLTIPDERPLASGAHTITAEAEDIAGNRASATVEVVIDTSPPVAPSAPDLDPASDTGAFNDDNYTSAKTPTFRGTGEPVTDIRLYSGTALIGTGVAGNEGEWGATSTSLQDGSHTISATSVDVAGNESTPSPGLVVRIDTSAAPPTLDLAASSDSGASPTDNLTNDTTPTFQGTTEAGATVSLYNDMTLSGTAVADENGFWSLTATLAEGRHSMVATAVDVLGNQSAPSDLVDVTIDTSAPASPGAPDLIASSDSGFSQTDNITSDTTPTFVGTAERHQTIRVHDADQLYETVEADENGLYALTKEIAPGGHALAATAVDLAGNESERSAVLNVLIDTVAPNAPTVDLPDEVNDDNRTSVPFSISGEPGTDFSFTVNDVGAAHSISNTGSLPFSAFLDLTEFTNGTITATATLTDAAGNTSSPGTDTATKQTS